MTVLAVFQAIGVRDDLFSMVFGESVLNDAVAIVLSRTLITFADPDGDGPLEGAAVDSASILGAVQSFFVIFVGSTIIGIIYGLLSAWIFKKLDLRRHDEAHFMESALSFAFPWGAYFTAEASALSGIVAIMMCGIVMATYTRLNLSKTAVMLTSKAYKCIALIAETFVFVYIGMAIVTFPIMENTVWAFVVVALGACFIGRLHIPIGSGLTNCCRGPESHPPRINGAYQFIMWWSGLRGGVAFALATMVYGKGYFGNTAGSDGLAILQATMIIAVFTIFVFGGSITSVARSAGVLKTKAEKQADASLVDEPMSGGLHTCLMDAFTVGKAQPAGFSGTAAGGARFAAAVEQPYHDITDEDLSSPSGRRGTWGVEMIKRKATPTSEIKNKVAHDKWMFAVQQVTAMSRQELSTADKVDELRSKLPQYSQSQLTKLLEASDGSVDTAVQRGKSSSARELL